MRFIQAYKGGAIGAFRNHRLVPRRHYFGLIAGSDTGRRPYWRAKNEPLQYQDHYSIYLF